MCCSPPAGRGRSSIQRRQSFSKVAKGTPSAADTASSAESPRATPSSTRRIAPGPPRACIASTATATSAKASAAASWLGSLAIDGCIWAKVTSFPLRAASRSMAADQGERMSPPGPRQRDSYQRAIPSCSQMGVSFRVSRVTTWWTYSWEAVSSQS